MPSTQEILARAAARKQARALIELATGESQEMTADARLRFWEVIRDAAIEHAPLPSEVVEQLKPMTEDQAKMFERFTIPYGANQGQTVDAVMTHDKEWLDWLVDAPDDFRQQLRRYLLSERGKARMYGRAF